MTEERQADGPEPDAPDVTQLSGRLMYLFVLLKRGDALLRRGSRSALGVLQGQGRVLRLLSLHSPIAQKELVYLLGIRSQSLGELLGKLEASGLVRRSTNPEDRRTWVVEITEEGRRAVEEQPSVEDDPFAVLDESERRQLADLLDRVIDGLEKTFPGGMDRRLRMMRHVWSGQDMPGGDDRWSDADWGFRRHGGPGWFGGPQHPHGRGER